MPKPACVKCKRFYRPKKNGARALEQMPTVDGAKPGTQDEDLWAPYKIWHADLWQCEGCGHELIVGYGRLPEYEHHHPEMDLALLLPHHKINDC
jgi:hypothetical protein